MKIWIVSFAPAYGNSGVGGFDWYVRSDDALAAYDDRLLHEGAFNDLRLVEHAVLSPPNGERTIDWAEAVTAYLDANIDGVESAWPALRESKAKVSS